MVGKLNDMLSMAVFIDSLSGSKSSNAHSSNDTTKSVNRVESGQSGKSEQSEQPEKSSLTSMLKTEDTSKTTDPTKKAEEAQQSAQEESIQRAEVTTEDVKKTIEALNKYLKKENIDLEFNYDEEVGMVNVKVIGEESQKVIREFPPEEMLERIRKANEKSKEFLGALIDKLV